MGRPIDKSQIGLIAGTGQQVQCSAWVAGDSQTRVGSIIRQKGNSKYIVDTTAAGGGIGICSLKGSTPSAAGEMSILVYPFGSPAGSGVSVTTTLLGVSTFTITSPGTGTVASDYAVGQILTLAGNGVGTQAQFTVASVKARLASAQATGSGYVTGDTLTFSGAGYTTPIILTVTASAGAITALAVTQAGVYTGAIPGDPVTPTSTSGSGINGTVNIGWAINALTITNPGAYSTLPSGAQATTVSGGTGAGATITVNTFGLVGATIGAGGIDYQSPLASFNAGTAAATVNVVDGVVTGITVTDPGSYTVKPVMTIAESGSTPVEYAANIAAHRVRTFAGNNYKWRLQPATISAGEASIQSA